MVNSPGHYLSRTKPQRRELKVVVEKVRFQLADGTDPDPADIASAANRARYILGTQKLIGLAAELGVSDSTISSALRARTLSRRRVIQILDGIERACGLHDEDMDDEPDSALGSSEWVRPKDGAQAIISEISELLARVTKLAGGANYAGDGLLSELERAQMTALLETALLQLKGPLVERSFLSKLGHTLSEVGKRAVEKQVELALGAAASAAGATVTLFVSHWL